MSTTPSLFFFASRRRRVLRHPARARGRTRRPNVAANAASGRAAAAAADEQRAFFSRHQATKSGSSAQEPSSITPFAAQLYDFKWSVDEMHRRVERARDRVGGVRPTCSTEGDVTAVGRGGRGGRSGRNKQKQTNHTFAEKIMPLPQFLAQGSRKSTPTYFF